MRYKAALSAVNFSHKDTKNTKGEKIFHARRVLWTKAQRPWHCFVRCEKNLSLKTLLAFPRVLAPLRLNISAETLLAPVLCGEQFLASSRLNPSLPTGPCGRELCVLCASAVKNYLHLFRNRSHVVNPILNCTGLLNLFATDVTTYTPSFKRVSGLKGHLKTLSIPAKNSA
jgi:hypothetical protein